MCIGSQILDKNVYYLEREGRYQEAEKTRRNEWEKDRRYFNSIEEAINNAVDLFELKWSLEGATVKLIPWKGRMVSSSKLPESIDLAQVSQRILELFFIRTCSQEERKPLKALSKMMINWYSETEEKTSKLNMPARVFDWLIYGEGVLSDGPKKFWLDGDYARLENYYTKEQLKEAFQETNLPSCELRLIDDNRREYYFVADSNEEGSST